MTRVAAENTAEREKCHGQLQLLGMMEGHGWRTIHCFTPADLSGNSRKLKAIAKENLKLKTNVKAR